MLELSLSSSPLLLALSLPPPHPLAQTGGSSLRAQIQTLTAELRSAALPPFLRACIAAFLPCCLPALCAAS